MHQVEYLRHLSVFKGLFGPLSFLTLSEILSVRRLVCSVPA